MAEFVAVDATKVFRVRAKNEVACRVGIAHRGDFEGLVRKGIVLAVDGGNGAFYLVEPVGALSFLRKECIKVVGPAPKNIVVEATKKGFVSRRV